MHVTHTILILYGSALAVQSQMTGFVPCEEVQPETYVGPPLPVLPDQYETSVEANIVQKNYTTTVREYYDYPNNRFTTEWTYQRDGKKVRMVGRPEQNETFSIYDIISDYACHVLHINTTTGEFRKSVITYDLSSYKRDPMGCVKSINSCQSAQIVQTDNNRYFSLLDNTCHVRHINTSGGGFYWFVSDDGGTHVKNVKDLLQFGSEFGEKYIGESTVRGIPVDQWQSCMKYTRGEGNFTLDYYFTKNASYVYDGRHVRIPVRAVLQGQGTSWRNRSAGVHSYYHYYDFFDFHAGPIKNTEVFEIPVGVYCNGSNITKPLPLVHDHFTAGVEMVTEMDDFHTEVASTMYTDTSAGVMRQDYIHPLTQDDLVKYGNKPLIYISDNNTDMNSKKSKILLFGNGITQDDMMKYGDKPLSYIYLMKLRVREQLLSGLLYIIDQWERNCTVMSADKAGAYFTTPEQFQTVFKLDYVYQGKKVFRGFSVESWAFLNNTQGTITELLFHEFHMLDEESTDHDHADHATDSESDEQLRLVGMVISDTHETSGEAVLNTINFYGFNPSHPAPEVFDVSSCYSLGYHFVYLALQIEGSYQRDVLYRKREFIVALRSAIARGSGVSVTRVTSILVEQSRDDDTKIVSFFKMLDNQIYGVPPEPHLVGPDLAQAKVNLQEAIAKGLNFDVQYPTIEQNFEIVKDTLWETFSTMSQRTDKPRTLPTYSAGAMAGLGIGMLVIGAILGLLVAFVIYKRIDTTVPYQVTR